MNEIIIDALKDTIKDTATLLPFLFVTYLAMEWIEGRTEEQSVRLLSKVGRASHLLGAAIGLIPQCGFSAAAASLYSGGVITAGTLLAVFLSTSDEMLPIFISSSVGAASIARILFFKFVIAFISGMAIDAVLRAIGKSRREEKHIHDLCEQDQCGCEDEEGGIVRSALVHTAKITFFIFIVSLAISLLVGFAGKDAVASLMSGVPALGSFICGLVGLIPNCAASVVIAELYLENMLSAGQMMSGLLVGAGVGILVLARTNRRPRENVMLIAMLYLCGVVWGLLIDAAGVTF